MWTAPVFTLMFVLFLANDVLALKCYKCESVRGSMNEACIKGENIKGEPVEGFPSGSGKVLCYKFKGEISGLESIERDIRAKATDKYNGKCVDTKDMADGEFPAHYKGLFCSCEKDLCNTGPVAKTEGGSGGGGGSRAAVKSFLYPLCVLLALTLAKSCQF